MKIFERFIFLWGKPKIILITGEGSQTCKESILRVLSPHFKIGKEILIFEAGEKETKELKLLAKKASLFILVAASFSKERAETEKIRNLNMSLKPRNYLILNFDDEAAREIKTNVNSNTLTFGQRQGADFMATDVKLNGGTNFKINYEGNTVPVWLEGLVDKENIYAALAATAVATILELNLVEISQSLSVTN